MATQYPDTTLNDDVLDPDFGGQTSTAFGGPAFKWINSMLRFLGAAYLRYARVPYGTLVVVTQQACAAGQALVFSADLPQPGGAYYVAPYNAPGLTNRRFVGLALEAASAGARVRAAPLGVVPAAITGVTPGTAAGDLGIDPTSARLRVATGGDTVVGRNDLQGNALLFAYGAAV